MMLSVFEFSTIEFCLELGIWNLELPVLGQRGGKK
jgi:hypothetical protein